MGRCERLSSAVHGCLAIEVTAISTTVSKPE
jgi:hypothetical protein